MLMMFGGVLWILLLAIIIWVVFQILYKNRNTLNNYKTKSAMDILKKRYAKGEITKEEFEQMKRDLS